MFWFCSPAPKQELTAVGLVALVQTVVVSVTEPVPGDAAAVPTAVLLARLTH